MGQQQRIGPLGDRKISGASQIATLATSPTPPSRSDVVLTADTFTSDTSASSASKPMDVAAPPLHRPPSFWKATEELRQWLGQVERHRSHVVIAIDAAGIREESECFSSHDPCCRCRGRCNCQFFD